MTQPDEIATYEEKKKQALGAFQREIDIVVGELVRRRSDLAPYLREGVLVEWDGPWGIILRDITTRMDREFSVLLSRARFLERLAIGVQDTRYETPSTPNAWAQIRIRRDGMRQHALSMVAWSILLAFALQEYTADTAAPYWTVEGAVPQADGE